MMNGPSMGPTGDSSMYGGGGVDPGMYGGSVPASGYGSYTDDYTADPMRSGGGSASAGQTSPWTSAMQQRFSAGGPYTQSQQQMPPSSGMSGHYGNMYNRMNMQQRMSPQRPQDKPFFNTPHKQVSEQKLNAFLFRVPEATQGGGLHRSLDISDILHQFSQRETANQHQGATPNPIKRAFFLPGNNRCSDHLRVWSLTCPELEWNLFFGRLATHSNYLELLKEFLP